jgi:hypothetical protein
MEQLINLELTVSEVNTILASLGKHPFSEIAVLIGKIKSQGDSQLSEVEAKAAEAQDEAATYAAAAQQRERERLHQRFRPDPMKLTFKVCHDS